MVYDVWCHVYLLLSEIPHRKMFFFSFSFFFFFFVFLVCPFGQSLSLLSVDLSFLLENLALSLHPLLDRSNHCIDANIRNHLYKCKDAMIATTNISNICNCELLAMCFLWRFLVVTTLCVCYWWVGEMKTKWQSDKVPPYSKLTPIMFPPSLTPCTMASSPSTVKSEIWEADSVALVFFASSSRPSRLM